MKVSGSAFQMANDGIEMKHAGRQISDGTRNMLAAILCGRKRMRRAGCDGGADYVPKSLL
jgi:hypothetical protein